MRMSHFWVALSTYFACYKSYNQSGNKNVIGEVNMKTEWRCEECGTLLGVTDGRTLTCKYKEVKYILTKGQIKAVCRKCKKTSTFETK